MRVIRIGFSRPKKFNLISSLIRLIQRTAYSHSYIVFDFKSLDRFAVYEASHGDVHFVEFWNWSLRNTEVYSKVIQVDEDRYKKIVQYCIDQSNKPYSIVTLFLMAFNIKWNVDSDRAFICSELIAKALGLKVQDYFSPKELYEYVNNLK